MGNRVYVLMSLLALWKRVAGGRWCSEMVILNATKDSHFVTTPNYPVQYTNNEQCRWLIRVTTDYEVVKLSIVDSKLQASATCGEDYGDIKDGGYTWARSMRKWCGDVVYDKVITSSGSAVLLTFRSNKEVTDRGFKVEYWSAPKTRIIYTQPVYGTANYILFGLFSFIVFSLLFGALVICLLHKHRAYTRCPKPAVNAKENMAYSHCKIYDNVPSRGSSARTRLCSVTPTDGSPLGLTPV